MTKKDYEIIADVFVKAQPGRWDSLRDHTSYGQVMWSDLRSKMADALAADNPKFDRAKFLTACLGDES